MVVTVAAVVASCVTALASICRQWRLRARDRDDAKLARHVFDQTRSPTVLADLANLRNSGRILSSASPPDSSEG